MRRFEERRADLYGQLKIGSFPHLYAGEQARQISPETEARSAVVQMFRADGWS